MEQPGIPARLPLSAHQGSGDLPGALVPERGCGSCVACCDILNIDEPELQKPANVLCRHNTGSSCGIYADRPNVCRTYFCLWRRMPELPDECRPDRLGIVFSIDRNVPARNPFEQFFVVGRALRDVDAFETPAAAAALDIFIQEGSLPVWLSYGGNKSLAYPAKPLVEAINNPWGTVWSHLVPLALTWRKRLGMDRTP